jgi:hypothetical protein
VRRELLDHFLIFGQRHLIGVLGEFLAHYHRARPHQGLDQHLPTPTRHPSSLPATDKSSGRIGSQVYSTNSRGLLEEVTKVGLRDTQLQITFGWQAISSGLT